MNRVGQKLFNLKILVSDKGHRLDPHSNRSKVKEHTDTVRVFAVIRSMLD